MSGFILTLELPLAMPSAKLGTLPLEVPGLIAMEATWVAIIALRWNKVVGCIDPSFLSLALILTLCSLRLSLRHAPILILVNPSPVTPRVGLYLLNNWSSANQCVLEICGAHRLQSSIQGRIQSVAKLGYLLSCIHPWCILVDLYPSLVYT